MATNAELTARLRRIRAERLGRSHQFPLQGPPMSTTTTQPAPAAPAAPQADSSIPLMATSHLHENLPMLVFLVGAGGTGARIVPPLMQMLRPTDSLHIIDHDVVEDRNLLRQHFSLSDVGQHKASVLADRYRQRDIPISAYAAQLTPATCDSVHQAALANRVPRGNTLAVSPAGSHATIILGAVDNAAARVAMRSFMINTAGPTAWIDAGNERRGGQVLTSLKNWPLSVKGGGQAASSGNFFMDGLQIAMPQLLRKQPWGCAQCGITMPGPATSCSGCKRPEESCADRIDTQTVQVNHLSAAAVINAFAQLQLGIPFTAAGTFFSTLNTMQPIKLARVEIAGGARTLLPETTYALAAD